MQAARLPSVAPFEAGSVFGCTDCGNRAGLCGRQSRHDQPFRQEADESCEVRLLPSVAPFEAGSVLGYTDCGNRAGLWETESS